MNILLNIPKDIIEKYQEVADLDKRSRKNLMEKVLIEYFDLPHKPEEPKEQFQQKWKSKPTSDYLQQRLNSKLNK